MESSTDKSVPAEFSLQSSRDDTGPVVDYASPTAPPSLAAKLWTRWRALPLYFRILIALLVGLIVGVSLGPKAAPLAIPSNIILRLLGALAPPLILVAVIQALMGAHIKATVAGKMAWLLLLNTVVAIGIGLLVANTIQPGRRVKLDAPKETAAKPNDGPKDPITQFLDSVPDSLLKPLVDNNVLGVICIAMAFGISLRSIRHDPIRHAKDAVDLCFAAIVKVLSWVIALVPLGVFGIVASIIGVRGFKPFVALGAFVLAVLLGLSLQALWYLGRIRLKSWVRPGKLLAGTKDCLLMAFSTGSSTAAMPVTYANLVTKVGLRPESASLGALVGTNFNNDGTALYEAMSALFVSQLLGHHLTIFQQLIIVLTSVIASVGAAGIPEAGLVTMTLVFNAVKLPTEYIALLLTVDWFLDRARTAINVMGDINVSCLIDGHHKYEASTDGGPNEMSIIEGQLYGL